MTATDGTIPTAGRAGPAPSFLARQPVAVLGGVCGLALLFIGWAAVESPLPTLIGGLVWAALLAALPLHRRIRRGFAPGPAADRPASPQAWTNPSMAFVGPDLVMEGCLAGPGEVEVFGRLSGAVLCDSVRVHPGGALEASVACRRFSVVAGARFEGVAQPVPAAIAVQPAPARLPAPRREARG